MAAEMKLNNKFFENIDIEQFNYWENFPERRRIPIVNGQGGRKFDTVEQAKDIYDAAKLNAFIKVVNDRIFLATSWSESENNYVNKMLEYISFKNKSAKKLNFELFRELFHSGNFFNIEIFKYLITLVIQKDGIQKIVFKRMAYNFPVSLYKRSVKNTETFKRGKDYTVVISTHGNVVCVAMWAFAMPYF